MLPQINVKMQQKELTCLI